MKRSTINEFMQPEIVGTPSSIRHASVAVMSFLTTTTQPAMRDQNSSPVATAQRGASVRFSHGDLTIDLVAFAARFRGKVLALRPNEFRLLAFFVANPDRVFSRKELIENLGKDTGPIDERTVDVWTGRLRRALRGQDVPDPLRTVRAYGYVLDSIIS
ncbi:MAG: winged helix-turn-helix domain-containing protein [Pseudomonadota bacterium]